MLQAGMVSGFALSLAIVRDTTPERQAASLIGYISMAMGLAPLLGPMLGGFLDSAYGWRAIFYLYAGLGVLVFLVAWVDLGETGPLGKGGETNRWESFTKLLGTRRFWFYAIASASATGAFHVFLTGAPLVAAVEFGIGTAELGVYIGSITAGFMLGGFLSGRFAERFDPHLMMLAGRLISCVGLSVGIVLVLSGVLSPLTYFASTIFVGLGNGITVPSSNSAALSVRPELAGSAAGLSGAMVVAVGAVLTTLTGSLLPEDGAGLVLLCLLLVVSVLGAFMVLAAWRDSGK